VLTWTGRRGDVGYWATGVAFIATAPARTRMMEMTAAKTGRSMKSWPWWLRLLRGRAAGAAAGGDWEVAAAAATTLTGAPGASRWKPSTDHLLPGLEPLLDDPVVARPVADDDRADFRGACWLTR